MSHQTSEKKVFGDILAEDNVCCLVCFPMLLVRGFGVAYVWGVENVLGGVEATEEQSYFTTGVCNFCVVF